VKLPAEVGLCECIYLLEHAYGSAETAGLDTDTLDNDGQILPSPTKAMLTGEQLKPTHIQYDNLLFTNKW